MKVQRNGYWLVAAIAALFLCAWPLPAQQPAQQQQQEEYTEEEYDAYEKAVQEKDGDKKQALLIAFMNKYPKSKLQQYIVTAYQTYMFELQKAESWAKLEPAAEAWMKYQPTDLQTVGFAAEAARRLAHYQKFADYALKLQAAKPSGALAALITDAYQKMGNQDKYLEWTEKLFEYPEFAGNFEMRMLFVKKHADAKNFAKAADYAREALKSLPQGKKPDTTSETDWRKAGIAVRRQCYFIIGMSHYEGGRFAEAIQALEQAVKAENFDVAYYYIGLSLWKLEKIEEAQVAFAKAVVLKGETEADARVQLEKLYRALHNNLTIGIDKIYNKAREQLGMPTN